MPFRVQARQVDGLTWINPAQVTDRFFGLTQAASEHNGIRSNESDGGDIYLASSLKYRTVL